MQIDIHIPPEAAYSYPILIGRGLLTQPERWLPSDVGTCVIISDETVDRYYGDAFVQALKQRKIAPLRLTFAPGESSKSSVVKQQLETKMFAHGCDRDTLIFALGGGVTGDLAGFIAATYMRGIAMIQLPTSLLAMVDSSIGGKTAINHAYGKNLIGAFLQPNVVVSDLDCLRTLPEAHRISGLIEAIKLFIACDKDHFQWVQQQEKQALLYDEAILTRIIGRAVSIKGAIVARDQKEQNGLRAICNVGHTIGHALERLSHASLQHGHAVALGLLVESRIAQLMGILAEDACLTIASFLERFGLEGCQLAPFDIETVIAATRRDKKARAGQVRYALLKQLGRVLKHKGSYTHVVSDTVVRQAFLMVKRGVSYGR